MTLTPKQQRFVDEYQIDLNATAAASRAGYSKNTAAEQGHQLLQKTSIIEAVQVAQLAVSKRVEVTVDDVVAGLLAEAEDKKDGTAGSRVAAWTQLGKHLGMDRRDINLRLDRPPASEMSPEERAAELARVQAELDAIEAKASAIDVDWRR